MTSFEYDNDKLDFVRKKRSGWWYFKRGLWLLQVSILLSIGYYLLFSLFVNTDEERKLKDENRAIENEYDELVTGVERLEVVVEGLNDRNKGIYHSLFEADPPPVGNNGAGEFFFENYEGISVVSGVRHISQILDDIDPKEKVCFDRLSNIERVLKFSKSYDDLSRIPSIIPVRNFSMSRVGANMGRKMHPFYKKFSEHEGMDFLVPIGTDILATASGVVTNVKRGDKHGGNVVEIDHQNGYFTSYSHLADVYVSRGQVVKQGRIIGKSGESGRTFAPHLHYEVKYKDNNMDPIHYFFADLTPDRYVDMIKTAMNQGQSMD